MQALHNGTNRTVHTKYCTEDRPETRKVCNPSACPAQWRTGAWSQCSVSCGEGIRQRQVVCRATDNTIGQCEGDKPETVLICKLSPCPGQSSLPPFTIEAMENSTTKTEGVHQIVPENPVHKLSSNEPCLGDKSIFCQMEVLARYCSIPGYNKLCCESCNKKEGFNTLFSPSPDLHKTGGSSDSETGPYQETSTQPNPTASTTLPSDSPLPTTTQSPFRTTKTPRRPRSTAQGLTTSLSAGAVVPQSPSLGFGNGDPVPGLPSLPPGPSPPLRPRPNAAPDSNGDPALSPSKEHSSPNNRSLGQAAGPGPEPGPAGAVAGVAAARSRREDVGSDSAHRTRTTRTLSIVLT
uniref:PLAC domain-containing protein n=1 Tax=Hucho hucho TaxID=62062 RepID=A0A4W5R8B6_9TELE